MEYTIQYTTLYIHNVLSVIESKELFQRISIVRWNIDNQENFRIAEIWQKCIIILLYTVPK